MSDALAIKLLNASTPTGASGAPGTFAAYTGGGMYVRLNSTSSTAATAGTQLANGNGYTTNGIQMTSASTASSGAGASAVTIPSATQGAITWTNSSGGWTIVSFELTTSDQVRTWFGDFTGQPITVAAGNSFQIAAGGISIDMS
jgi:uncharacterized RmlC-like cupin family protein